MILFEINTVLSNFLFIKY